MKEIIIYSLNDFHGALLPHNTPGISKIGAFLLSEKKQNPEILIISSGDMFQGTLLSSLTRGRAVVEAMNLIGFDAMTVGNHEFDWGTEILTCFQNGIESDGEANFPFLGANIVLKESLKTPEWLTPYTIFKRENLKIGVIGVIGQNFRESILASKVKDVLFTDEMEAIKKYSRLLRSEHGCQIIIVLAHTDSFLFNQKITELDEDSRVDALINGHTHRYYAAEIRSGKVPLPIIQSGNCGRYIGKISFKIDQNIIIDAEAENIDMIKCGRESPEINQLLRTYQEEFRNLDEIIGFVGEAITKEQAITWAVDALRAATGAKLALINFGAIRSEAFPMSSESLITYDSLFRMMPFEDRIVLITLRGKDLLPLIDAPDIKFSSNFNPSESIFKEEDYRIATLDYLYEKENYPFLAGRDLERTDLFRDFLYQEVLRSVAEKGNWKL